MKGFVKFLYVLHRFQMPWLGYVFFLSRLGPMQTAESEDVVFIIVIVSLVILLSQSRL
jgi:hypothetical protein